jgi:hypothetical protein
MGGGNKGKGTATARQHFLRKIAIIAAVKLI